MSEKNCFRKSNLCLQIGWVHETSKQQTKTISSGADVVVQINRVNKNLNKRYPNQNQNKMRNKYIWCGKFPAHKRNDCLAINVCCRQCSKIGHYASVCRNKSEVREQKDGNFWGSITLEKVNSVKGVEEWQAKIKVTVKVCSKIINFRLDTGADVTVIIDRFFKKFSNCMGDKLKIIWARSQRNVVRRVEATLDTRKISSQQDLYVVKN